MGVRKTTCRGRLARSGTVAGSFWQLANILTIRVLQICACRTRINISPAKKTDLPFRRTSSYMSIRLFAWLQIDIADLDSVQLRKDRKGWFCVRIAFFFCLDGELQRREPQREVHPPDVDILAPKLASRNVTLSVSQEIFNGKSCCFGRGRKSNYQVR